MQMRVTVEAAVPHGHQPNVRPSFSEGAASRVFSEDAAGAAGSAGAAGAEAALGISRGGELVGNLTSSKRPM